MEFLGEETDNNVGEFSQYFEATSSGFIQGGKRRKPVYIIDLLSVHETVAND